MSRVHLDFRDACPDFLIAELTEVMHAESAEVMRHRSKYSGGAAHRTQSGNAGHFSLHQSLRRRVFAANSHPLRPNLPKHTASPSAHSY